MRGDLNRNFQIDKAFGLSQAEKGKHKTSLKNPLVEGSSSSRCSHKEYFDRPCSKIVHCASKWVEVLLQESWFIWFLAFLFSKILCSFLFLTFLFHCSLFFPWLNNAMFILIFDREYYFCTKYMELNLNEILYSQKKLWIFFLKKNIEIVATFFIIGPLLKFLFDFLFGSNGAKIKKINSKK